jgi:3-deoxy-D-manno-octulosonic-acid transferase
MYRIFIKGKYKDSFLERFGRLKEYPVLSSCIWIHGVSVGEIKAAKPLIQKLETSYPEKTILISATSTSGRKIAKELYPTHIVVPFPLDLSWSIHSYFKHFSPECILLMELELWPNILHQAKKNHIPVILINGRLSEHSFKGYSRLGKLFSWMTHSISCFSVQNDLYAERFKKLGINENKIDITGNIKFDALSMSIATDIQNELRNQIFLPENVPVLMVGSSHAPEEKIILHSFKQLQEKFSDFRLILVPRNPQRSEEIANWIQEMGYISIKKSHIPENFIFSPHHVLIADIMGELNKLYSLATIVFIGGSLIPHGGQNFIEAAALGKPVVCGSYMNNFPDIRFFVEQKAVVQVENSENLTDVFIHLFTDEMERQQMVARAIDIIKKSQGSTERNFKIIQKYLH